MKRLMMLLVITGIVLSGCQSPSKPSDNSDKGGANMPAGMSAVNDNVSQKNIVQIALGSKDHTTLVEALKASGLVDVLANPGPFTVFAPTNAAFEKLPKGTVEELLKPEKKSALKNVLFYHVNVSIFKSESFRDGQVMNMFSGQPATFSVKDGKVIVNGNATIIASIPASNGIIHVVDGVMLAPAK
ncbi:fasciclin domain-containing protein [bacterium]|nr:fasciclin domain-containing protein [bacterium]